MEELVFDLKRIEVPVTLGGVRHILVEASEDAVRTWRNVAIRGTRMEDGKVVGMDGLADTDSLLVSRCLYVADAEGRLPLLPNGMPNPQKLVSQPAVLSWPNKVVKKLAARVREISDLEDETSLEALEKQRHELDKRIDKIREKGKEKNAATGDASTPSPSAGNSD